ncbi:hypothetical protein [Thermogemmata fonticola]|uniref:DUF7133 domain-containing protein n=1 Tax=Thermogemmata fonticola TaxID=2755323 RepID=A0A7V8VEP9_9BACT|nr:hypothetical protein [Thermogemmata fonticola]MBA2226586.1 hypothetical protein [Thermogemmata fonticola]
MNPLLIRRRVVWTMVLLLMAGIAGGWRVSEVPAAPWEASAAMQAPASDSPLLKGQYVKKGNRADTIRATLAAFGLPNLEGEWYHIGPFDNTDNAGFDTPYPPEKKFDPTASYLGKGNQKVTWQKLEGFTPGRIFDLIRLYPRYRTNTVAYLYHRFESPLAFRLAVSLGSDDTLSVFFNGKRLLHEPYHRAAAADQDFVELDIQRGSNELLLKIGQAGGDWAVYINPAQLPTVLPAGVRQQLDKDFPFQRTATPAIARGGREAEHYRLLTIPLPSDCVLEVGGLGFRPDSQLLACTRRGEIWRIENALAEDPQQVRFHRFASGLHEALGLWVESNQVVYVVQRPELTRIRDVNGDGLADEYVTVCDQWGVSGDYHEFAFGPARDKQGNFYITLNVGFGGGHQAKVPWRGWCVKVTPQGRLEPVACGLRSPNGINFSPDGELFYCDNQGEWVATNKMHHIRPGRFFGHQASLRWVKDSPFAGLLPDKAASGMRYDGVDGSGRFTGRYPPHDPPAIWFPYGRMGQSVSEPVWDTTGGKFGPFAGQCFVGDQTRATVMRVALEQVNGVYQGACFPFRSGLQCGVNRLCFAPDGSLMIGQTNRGWGSLGGKPYGLQRLIYTGKEPFEVHHITLTPQGFDLVFTQPLDPASIAPAQPRPPITVSSFTYIYHSNYGCPEIDTRAEKVGALVLSPDRRTLTVPVEGLRKGRVYEIRLEGIRNAQGEALLHPEAYYTLNELRR